MPTVHEIEVWVMVNESGEYEVAADEGDCGERFSSNCGTSEATRKVCLKLKVPGPEPITLAGEIPAEPVRDITLSVV